MHIEAIAHEPLRMLPIFKFEAPDHEKDFHLLKHMIPTYIST